MERETALLLGALVVFGVVVIAFVILLIVLGRLGLAAFRYHVRTVEALRAENSATRALWEETAGKTAEALEGMVEGEKDFRNDLRRATNSLAVLSDRQARLPDAFQAIAVLALKRVLSEYRNENGGSG